MQEGKLEESEEMIKKIITGMQQSELDKQHEFYERLYENLGNIYFSQAKFEQAYEMFLKLKDVQIENYGEEHESLI